MSWEVGRIESLELNCPNLILGVLKHFQVPDSVFETFTQQRMFKNSRLSHLETEVMLECLNYLWLSAQLYRWVTKLFGFLKLICLYNKCSILYLNVSYLK